MADPNKIWPLCGKRAPVCGALFCFVFYLSQSKPGPLIAQRLVLCWVVGFLEVLAGVLASLQFDLPV